MSAGEEAEETEREQDKLTLQGGRKGLVRVRVRVRARARVRVVASPPNSIKTLGSGQI